MCKVFGIGEYWNASARTKLVLKKKSGIGASLVIMSVHHTRVHAELLQDTETLYTR